jgi:hypothetical protein
MKEPDFEKAAEEVNEMQRMPPVSVEISLEKVLAMINVIQAAVQMQPEIADDGWAKIGIAAAQQLGKDLFKQYPETCKVLGFCWKPEVYIVTPETIAAMMRDIESRRSGIISDQEPNTGSAETLSERICRKFLDSQGYGALDM